MVNLLDKDVLVPTKSRHLMTQNHVYNRPNLERNQQFRIFVVEKLSIRENQSSKIQFSIFNEFFNDLQYLWNKLIMTLIEFQDERIEPIGAIIVPLACEIFLI